jgi:hypothetical protein
MMTGNRKWILDARLCGIVLVAFATLALFPVQSGAGLIGSRLADGAAAAERAAQIETVRQGLEQEIVAQRLADFGLTAEEVAAKLPTLSDEQLHQLATLSKDIAGGDGLEVVIALLVIVLLVVVILKLMDKEIIVR